MKKLKLQVVETTAGVYVAEQEQRYGGTKLLGYMFDEKPPKETFHKQWILLSKLPVTITKEMPDKPIDHRYELIDKDMESKKTPLILQLADVEIYDEEEGTIWSPRFEHLKSLYKLRFDLQIQPDESIDFEVTQRIRVDVGNLHEPEKIEYSVSKSAEVTNGGVSHQLMDEILFPNILLPTRPSRLTSKQSYDIVRHHIVTNMDYNEATITSDYDFCFTVKKRVHVKPFEVKTEILTSRGKRYKKPQYNTKMVKDNLIECFEMTHSPKNYGKYTPIPGFEGKDESDLKRQIDAYLKDLMAFINLPLDECSICKGKGAVLRERKEDGEENHT